MQDKKNAKLVPLSELVVSINSGLNPRNNFKLNEEDGVCLYVNVKNLQADTETVQDCDRISVPAMEKIKKKCNLEVNDILVPAIFTNKPLAIMINDKIKDIGISENVYAIKPNNKIYAKYLLYMLRTSFVQNQIREIVDNKPLARITKNMLMEIKIPFVEFETQEEIAEILYQLEMAHISLALIQSKLNYITSNVINVMPANENKDISLCFSDIDAYNDAISIVKHTTITYKEVSNLQNKIIKLQIQNKKGE